MNYIKINEKLAHLSEEEINDLISKYYNGIKNSDLIKEYNIDTIPSMLYKLFPPEICDNIKCPVCKIPMIKNRESKSSYRFNKNSEYCIKCGHNNNLFCNCDFCKGKRAEKFRKEREEKIKRDKEKRALIYKVYDLEKNNPVKLSDLSLKDRIYTGALLRAALSEDMKNIGPLNLVEKKLAPTENLIKEMLNELSKKNIIVVSPESDIEAFVDSCDGGEFPYTYYVYKVRYILNIDFEDSYSEGISSILNPNELLEYEKEEALSIWRRIALEECLEYLDYQMKSVKFNFNVGDKTIMTFKDILEDFSVSQIYGIIYKSIANATKYYQESNISRKQAANSVISGCQRYYEKAVIEKWDLTKYWRIRELPQSVISEFLFNKVLKIGNLGFDMPPVEL